MQTHHAASFLQALTAAFPHKKHLIADAFSRFKQRIEKYASHSDQTFNFQRILGVERAELRAEGANLPGGFTEAKIQTKNVTPELSKDSNGKFNSSFWPGKLQT